MKILSLLVALISAECLSKPRDPAEFVIIWDNTAASSSQSLTNLKQFFGQVIPGLMNIPSNQPNRGALVTLNNGATNGWFTNPTSMVSTINSQGRSGAAANLNSAFASAQALFDMTLNVTRSIILVVSTQPSTHATTALAAAKSAGIAVYVVTSNNVALLPSWYGYATQTNQKYVQVSGSSDFSDWMTLASRFTGSFFNSVNQVCRVFGTGNVITLDGASLDVQNTGVFRLLKYGTVEVQGLFSPCFASASVSCLMGVSLLDTTSITSSSQVYAVPGSYQLVQAYKYDGINDSPEDNLFVSTMTLLPEGAQQVVMNLPGWTVQVTIKSTPLGLSVRLPVAGSWINGTSGICGNYNTCGDDDAAMFYSSNAEAFRVDPSQVGFGKNNIQVASLNLPNVTSSSRTEYKQSSSQDCGSLPKNLVGLCNSDVSQTSAAGIDADYKELLTKECSIFCSGALPVVEMPSVINSQDCQQFCSKFQTVSQLDVTSLNSSDNDVATPPFLLTPVQSNNISILQIPEAASGQYCLNTSATDVFGRSLEQVQYIRVTCEGSASSNLTLNADDVKVEISPVDAYFSVQLSASVNDPSRVRKQFWEIIDGPYYPEIEFATGFKPRFVASFLGKYTLRWYVYDGCAYQSKDVSVVVGCSASDQSNFPLAFINSQQMLLMNRPSSPFYAQNTFTVTALTGNFGLTYSWNISFSTPLNVTWSSPTQVQLRIPGASQMVNQSTTFGTPTWTTQAATTATPTSYANALTGQTMVGFSISNVSTTNVTSQPYDTTSYYINTAAVDICQIDFTGALTSNFQPRFTDRVPGGCASLGVMTLQANVTNVCGSFIDTVPIEVSCGPKPFALIGHCGVGSGACNYNEVRSSSLPAATNLIHKFDYSLQTFPSQSLLSGESYDKRQRTLIKAWNVTSTSFTTTNTAVNYLTGSGGLASSTVTFKAIEAGTYTVALNVSAGGCSSSVDSIVIQAQCPQSCSAPLQFVSDVSTYVSGGSVTATSTVSNSTCQYLRTQQYKVSRYPAAYYDGTLIAFLGLTVPLQSSVSTVVSGNVLPVSYTISPTYGGTYQYSLIGSDGCTVANSTKPVVVTCPFTLTTPQIAGSASVSDTNGVFSPVTYTGSVNLNGNSATATYGFIVSQAGVPISGVLTANTYTFTPTSAGSYNVTMLVHDGCQYVKTTVMISVTCSVVAAPQIVYDSVTSNVVNITYTPRDVGYSPTWTVSGPAGSVSPSTVSTGITFSAVTPGSYVVRLFLTSACGSKSSTVTYTYVKAKTYSIALNSGYSAAPIVVVASSKGRGFPQVNVDAAQSVISDSASVVSYGSLYAASYWYVKSAPSDSVLKSYTVETYSTYGSLLISAGSRVDVAQYNSTSTYQRLVVQNSTTATVVTSTTISKLPVVCNVNDLPTSGMFSACFRPDVPGTYQLQLKVTGPNSDTYELGTPITVTASCASNLAIASLSNQALTGASSLIAPRRFTVEAGSIFNNLDNMQDADYSWVVYGSLNSYVPFMNVTANATQYAEVPVEGDRTSQLFLVNKYSRTISFVASRNFTSWIVSLTANTGCAYKTVNNSVDISFAPTSFGANKIAAYGSARYFGEDVLDGSNAQVFAINPDKRVGAQLEISVTAGVVLSGKQVSFGKCNHPQLLQAAGGNPAGLSAGAIAGIVIGVLAGVGLLGAGGFFVYRKFIAGGGGSKA